MYAISMIVHVAADKLHVVQLIQALLDQVLKLVRTHALPGKH